jgi:hypothetical protein
MMVAKSAPQAAKFTDPNFAQNNATSLKIGSATPN